MQGHGGVSIADEGSETDGGGDESRRTDCFGGDDGDGEVAATDEADDSRSVANGTTTTDRRERSERGDPHPSSSAETEVRSSADADLKTGEGGNGPVKRRPRSVPFVEVMPPTGGGTSEPPEWVEAYVCRLADPKRCSSLVKDLAELLPLRRGERRSKRGRGKKGRGDAEDEVLIRDVADGADGAMAMDDDDDPSFVDLGHLRRIRRTAVGDTVGARDAEKGVSSTPNGERSGDADAAAAATGNEASAERDIVEVWGKTKEASSSPSPTPTTQDQPPSHGKKKRRRQQRQNGRMPSPPSAIAAKSTTTTLEVLLGSVRAVSSLNPDELEGRILSRYPLSRPPEMRLLPGRPPRSHDDFVVKTETWPMIHFPKNTEEHQAEERRLSEEDVECMAMGMAEAVRDARASRAQYEEATAQWRSKRKDDEDDGCGGEEEDHGMETPPWMKRLGLGGAVVVCPRTKRVLSRSSDERAELIKLMAVSARDGGSERPKPACGDCDEGSEHEDRTTMIMFPDVVNPTCTAVLLALQGVSRRERAAALGSGMESDEFRNGQYLCTGLDVYTTIEPSVFEAMAMVHSRVGRAVFGVGDDVDGGLGGAGMDLAVHSLPGINHHYRVFRFDAMQCVSAPVPIREVYEECTKLHLKAAFSEGTNVGLT